MIPKIKLDSLASISYVLEHHTLDEDLFQEIRVLINFLLQLEENLLNSTVQLALQPRTRPRPQQTVAVQ